MQNPHVLNSCLNLKFSVIEQTKVTRSRAPFKMIDCNLNISGFKHSTLNKEKKQSKGYSDMNFRIRKMKKVDSTKEAVANTINNENQKILENDS